MKKLLIFAALFLQGLTANAIVLDEGSPRPVERAVLSVAQSSSDFENVRLIAVTRVHFEMTKNIGFNLELQYVNGQHLTLLYNVVRQSTGPDGETLFVGIPVDSQGAAAFSALYIFDNRTSTGERADEQVPAWNVEVRSVHRVYPQPILLRAEGNPSPIYTPMNISSPHILPNTILQ